MDLVQRPQHAEPVLGAVDPVVDEVVDDECADPNRRRSHQQNEVVTDGAAAATAAFVAGGYDTVYDGVMGPWFLPAFARRLGFAEFDYVVLLPSEEQCVERVRTRLGHGFTADAAARSMHRQFDVDRAPNGHVIEGDHLDAEAIADEVIQRRATGQLRIRSADL